MSRQLKFRVWDIRQKLFIYPAQGIQEYLSQTGLYEINQFTGFKDKSGKDIYENDIVKWHDYQGWEDGRTFYGIYVITWDEDLAMYQAHDPYDGLEEQLGNVRFDNIIGNIYETPDLLPSENDEPMTQIRLK